MSIQPIQKKDSLTDPIARSGEQIYATILRNRSGQDAGRIDYGARVFAIQDLCEGEQMDMIATGYALYCSIMQYCDKVKIRKISDRNYAELKNWYCQKQGIEDNSKNWNSKVEISNSDILQLIMDYIEGNK
jgi:hypothetical protein